MFSKKNKYQQILRELGKNIRELREYNNMTLQELSKKTNIRKEYLQKIEDGKAYGLDTLKFLKIAEALETPAHILVKGIKEN